jgi:hypothetical protein
LGFTGRAQAPGLFVFVGLQLEESGCLLLGESRKLRGIRGPKVVSSLLPAQGRQICPPAQIREVQGRNPGFRLFLFLGMGDQNKPEYPKTHLPNGGTWGTRL